MPNPTDRHYTQTHEWVMPDTKNVGYYKVGVTAFRLGQLGTITAGNFSHGNGTNAAAGDTVCTITGSTGNDVHAPMHGILRNERLLDGSGINSINTDPWGTDLFSVQAAQPSDYNNLMTGPQYDTFINT